MWTIRLHSAGIYECMRMAACADDTPALCRAAAASGLLLGNLQEAACTCAERWAADAEPSQADDELYTALLCLMVCAAAGKLLSLCSCLTAGSACAHHLRILWGHWASASCSCACQPCQGAGWSAFTSKGSSRAAAPQDDTCPYSSRCAEPPAEQQFQRGCLPGLHLPAAGASGSRTGSPGEP